MPAKLDGLKIAQEISERLGGICLSIKYIGIFEKLELECKNKHRWFASLDNIRHNHWCPLCANKIRANKKKLIKGLEIAQKMANSKGGKCLSAEYIGARNNMLWECKEKHKWSAVFYNIQSGRWCPECAPLQRAKSQTNSYILYHWKTSEEIVCQASWEKLVVEYLNINKINFRWQSKVFIMPNKHTYRPDLYLYSTKKWIEIKGYFRKDAKEKWDWFHTEHINSELWDKNKLKEMGIL